MRREWRVAGKLLVSVLRVLSMNFEKATFRDREDAGRQLAERLVQYRAEDPVVLALPRGGVPAGYEVARTLQAPLDTFIARKLGAPSEPELGMGAVAQDGTRVVNERIVREIGVSEAYIQWVAAKETAEAEWRLKLFRGDRPEPEVRERTVILVDDGIATGMTTQAAIQALRRQHPRRLILAVPVCAAQTADWLRQEVDELICLQAPSKLRAIGFWYQRFGQTSDEEVIELLERARREQDEHGANDPDQRRG